MLRPAQLYESSLREQLIQSWYKPENIYVSGWTGNEILELPDNNYNSHHFVSVDSKDRVIGYITYSVNWSAMSADQFGIISFNKGNLIFVKDLYQAIRNLFNVFHMNRISWCCYTDNPALRSYKNFVRKYGGRECGYKRQIVRLQDGKLHDSIEFEILAEEFKG